MRDSRPGWIASMLAVVLLAAAQCSPTVPAWLIGSWGCNHMGMVVSDAAAVIEYDCAHGEITERLRPDRDGDFTAVGVHIREHGGPVREGEPLDSHPARYTGRVRGSTM